MISFKTESAWRGTSDCRHCSIRHAALFGDLDEQDFHLIHAPIDDLLFPQESTIYQLGAPSQGVFTLRSGMIKLVRLTSDGCQRIVRVLRPGDVAGLEVLAAPHYDCEAVSLTDWLAELNFGTARRRVANLLLKMRSYKESRLTTVFSREDMGAMLDLKPETVSREVTRLVREGVIEPLDNTRRVYRVLQPERLQAA